MELKDCTLEELIQQKEQLEQHIIEHKANNDIFMLELDDKRMSEINRCIKHLNNESSD